jgi:hypothetical protein
VRRVLVLAAAARSLARDWTASLYHDQLCPTSHRSGSRPRSDGLSTLWRREVLRMMRSWLWKMRGPQACSLLYVNLPNGGTSKLSVDRGMSTSTLGDRGSALRRSDARACQCWSRREASVKHFEPETLAKLRAVFDDACTRLPHSQQSSNNKSAMAERILKLSNAGERDPVRLRDAALLRIV